MRPAAEGGEAILAAERVGGGAALPAEDDRGDAGIEIGDRHAEAFEAGEALGDPRAIVEQGGGFGEGRIVDRDGGGAERGEAGDGGQS